MKRSVGIGIIAACLVSIFVFSFGTTQVSELAGLAVAQGSKWIGVRDAAVGDGLGSGILASSLMMYDSASGTFNRLRGSTSFGIQVDVTRIQGGSITVVGNKTPSDTFANPTDAIASFSLLGYWDGTQWVRWRAFQDIDALNLTNSPHMQALNYGFNGTTFDRLRTGQVTSFSTPMTTGVQAVAMYAYDTVGSVTNTYKAVLNIDKAMKIFPPGNTSFRITANGDTLLNKGTNIALYPTKIIVGIPGTSSTLQMFSEPDNSTPCNGTLLLNMATTNQIVVDVSGSTSGVGASLCFTAAGTAAADITVFYDGETD